MSTETGEQSAPDPVPDTDPTPQTPAPPRPRRRTTLLLAAAVVLGVVGGAGAGYAVQANRPPTPLPPLVAVRPHYPAERLDAKAAAAAEPAPLAIDGDLRKLLIAKPKGAKEWDFMPAQDGWMPIDDMALMRGDPAQVFEDLLRTGFRRAAMVSWREEDVHVRVRLIQYRVDKAATVINAVKDARQCGIWDQPCTIRPIPGTNSGVAYVALKSQTYTNSDERYFLGIAAARRGDVLMWIEIHSPKKVALSHLMDLAKSQWGKL